MIASLQNQPSSLNAFAPSISRSHIITPPSCDPGIDFLSTPTSADYIKTTPSAKMPNYQPNWQYRAESTLTSKPIGRTIFDMVIPEWSNHNGKPLGGLSMLQTAEKIYPPSITVKHGPSWPTYEKSALQFTTQSTPLVLLNKPPQKFSSTASRHVQMQNNSIPSKMKAFPELDCTSLQNYASNFLNTVQIQSPPYLITKGDHPCSFNYPEYKNYRYCLLPNSFYVYMKQQWKDHRAMDCFGLVEENDILLHCCCGFSVPTPDFIATLAFGISSDILGLV